MFAWKFLVGRLWSWAAMMKLSVSDFGPNEPSHWWVSEEFTSGSLAWIGYLPWRGLSFHPPFSSLIFSGFACVLICFAFSVDVEFSEMFSLLRLIWFKYFLRIARKRVHAFIFLLFFFTSLRIQSLLKWIAKSLWILVQPFWSRWVITGIAKELIVSILLRAFNSPLRTDFTLLKIPFYFFLCKRNVVSHPPSLTLRFLKISSGSRFLMTLVVSRVMLLAFRSFHGKM